MKDRTKDLVAKLLGEAELGGSFFRHHPPGGDRPSGEPAPSETPASGQSHDTMTVGALIKFLEGFPDTTPVYYGHASGDHWRTQIAGSVKGGEVSAVKNSEYHQKMAVDTDAEAGNALILSGDSSGF